MYEREGERERLLMGVFLKFCVGMNLPLVPEEGLLACTKLCLCFYLFTPLPPSNDNFIFQLTPQNFTISENAVFNFICQVKQKTLIIWGEDDQIIRNNLAVVSLCYGYKA